MRTDVLPCMYSGPGKHSENVSHEPHSVAFKLSRVREKGTASGAVEEQSWGWGRFTYISDSETGQTEGEMFCNPPYSWSSLPYSKRSGFHSWMWYAWGCCHCIQDVVENADTCFDALSALSAHGVCPLGNGIDHDWQHLAQLTSSGSEYVSCLTTFL